MDAICYIFIPKILNIFLHHHISNASNHCVSTFLIVQASAAYNATLHTSENGLLQTDLVNIKGRWKRYIEQLYTANEKPDTSPLEEEHEVSIDALGPSFIYSEIEKAMSTLKKGKSAGVDEIPGELITILDLN